MENKIKSLIQHLTPAEQVDILLQIIRKFAEEEKPYLTTEEAEQRLIVCNNTLKDFCKQHNIKPGRVNHQLRYRKSELDSAMFNPGGLVIPIDNFGLDSKQ